jgi:hypothetical protein
MRSQRIRAAIALLLALSFYSDLAQAQVVISEFMAANSNGIRDDDGNHSDWIEIFNPGPSTTLDGWFLTDDPANLGKWRFPNGNAPLQPNSYFLLWASGRNKTNPEAPLHTNFKLSRESGYLALVDPGTNIISVFENYPDQTPDVSYGRDRVDPKIVGYFTSPTPNAQNTSSGSGFAPPPIFSYASGIYTNISISLVITSALGTIRYSTDGILPTSNSTLYTGPIIIGTNATIKARVFPAPNSGLLPSEVIARNYLFLDNTTEDFSSNLPLLIISTEGKSLGPISPPPSVPRTNGTITIIDVKNARSSLQGTPDLQVLAGFEYFGNSSAIYPKKPIRFETQDALGNDLNVSILGMPAGSDYKLKDSYYDRTLLRDYIATEAFEEMGHYSVRRRLVEVFVDTGGGRLNYFDDYYGVLLLLETIKIDKQRVDIARIPASATSEPAISGGYIFKLDLGDNLYFETSGSGGFGGQRFAMHDPTPNELRSFPTNNSPLTVPGSNQVNYLRTFLNQMEYFLYTNTWLTAIGTNQYNSYLDLPSFVDWFWMVEFPNQGDGYYLSTYFYKDRLGKVTAGPVWDYDRAFGYENDGSGMWRFEHFTTSWLARLLDDPDFTQRIADRWGVLRTNIFNAGKLLAHIDVLASSLNEAANREMAYYKISGVYYDRTTNSIIGGAKKYISDRYVWIDNQFTPPPFVSSIDGMVTNGYVVSISGKPGAQIYYTADGTDPRGPGGSTNGTLYTGPTTISGSMRIVARSFETNAWKHTWSGPAQVTLYTAVPPLRVTEIMYHPANAPTGSTNSASDFEYVEVKNIGGDPLNVNRFSISGGITFQFPNIVLEGGQSAVLVKDLAAFQSRYGTNNPNILILGTFTGQLSDAGDHLILKGGVGEPILDFSYADNWFPATDGLGFSLVGVDDSAPPSDWSLSSHWRPSNSLGGSPGQPDPVPVARAGVLINEVLAHTQPPADAIELYNPSSNPADIGGWFLSDDFASPKKYVIPPNTIIPAFGYLVFYETNSFNYPTNASTSFALGAKGDDVWLFSGDSINLTGYAHGFTFGASPAGRTFGRHVISTGEEQFVLQRASSLGAANAGPSVGPIVITEINAHPPDIAVNGLGYNNTRDEYIEFQNITGDPLRLYDSAFPSNTWRLHAAVSYSFPPTNVKVPAGGFLLIVSFDPEADPGFTADFRARNSVSSSLPLFGPWDGHLDNKNDNLELMAPDTPNADGSTTYFVVDNVNYSDSHPWPNGWDGTGLTLQRISPFNYGNDPSNWTAVAPTPGMHVAPSGTTPTITGQPRDQVVPTGRELLLSVTATGTALRYQWRRDGLNIPGATNSVLSMPNFQANEAGVYNVLVYNSAGSALGTEFTLTARTGLQILQQPLDRVTTNGGSTNFTIFALGTGPITYKWNFNGMEVNATNAYGAETDTLTITNVQLSNQGAYTVSLMDDFDTITSASATLTLVYRPLLTVHPISQPVVQGQPVTLTVAASGTTPMTFRWRKQTNGSSFVTVATNIGDGYSFFTISNFQLSDATNYNASVSNIVGLATRVPGGPPIGTSSNALLALLMDTDHDGLPDIWEAAHQGFSVTDPSDARRDDDHDGMSNLAEYIAGTDYLNPQSYLRVTIGTAGVVNLSFLAISNRTYSVLYSDRLSPMASQKLTDVLAHATNRLQSVTDPTPGPNRYYRLVTPIQP